MRLPPCSPKQLLQLQPSGSHSINRKKEGGGVGIFLFKGYAQKSHFPLHLPYRLTFHWLGLSHLAIIGKGAWEMESLFYRATFLAKGQGGESGSLCHTLLR